MSDLEAGEVWRVSYGTTDRQYLEIFTDYDVALVGWGHRGKWPSSAYDDLGKATRSSIRTLAERIAAGDIVIATRGYWDVGAIGVARDDPETGRPYRWNKGWVETEGWDLFHQIRVQWLDRVGRPPAPSTRFPRAYYASRVGDHAVREWARRRVATHGDHFADALIDLPTEERPLPRRAIRQPFRQAQQVAEDLREAYGDGILENTIVALEIVPLLLGLGFKPKQIRLEWRGVVDVAVFEDVSASAPILIVEAKQPRKGLAAAREQGKQYGRDCGEPALLVTNGLTLELFARRRYDSSPARLHLPSPRQSALDLFDALEKLAPR